MSGWVTVRVKASGQIQEMVPYVAEALIASGRAERYVPKQENTVPVLETATAPAPPNAALFVRMPRTMRRPLTGRA